MSSTLLLSGLVNLEPRDAAEAGADAYLPKPFSPLQLLSTIERLLAERALDERA